MVLYFYVLLEGVFHKLGSRLGFVSSAPWLPMAMAPYHRLWRGGTQTKRTGVIHTPWAACTWFGINPPGGQVVSTTTTNVNVSFCLSICALLMVHLICLVARHIPPAIIHPPPSNERERRRCDNQPVRRNKRGMARRERGGSSATREMAMQQERW